MWRCFIMITANSSQSNILNYHENVLNINFNLRPSSYSTNSNQQELDWWSTKRPFPGQDGGGRFLQKHRCCSFTSYSQFRLTHLQLLISECNKLISKKSLPVGSHDSSARDSRESNFATANFQSPIIATVASGDFCEVRWKFWRKGGFVEGVAMALLIISKVQRRV